MELGHSGYLAGVHVRRSVGCTVVLPDMKHDYRCNACRHTFEAETVKKQKRPRCPKCKSKRTKKLIPLPNITFKGDGWGKDKT